VRTPGSPAHLLSRKWRREKMMTIIPRDKEVGYVCYFDTWNEMTSSWLCLKRTRWYAEDANEGCSIRRKGRYYV
jgi:hypothetical protein